MADITPNPQTPDTGAPNTPAAPRTSIGRRLMLLLRFCWRVVLLFFIVVVCALLLIVGSLVTESGRLFWLERALPFVQTPALTVVVDDVRWPRLNQLHIGYALVTQNSKPLVELTGAALHISLSELWQKQLLVHELKAAKVAVYQPPSKDKPARTEPLAFTFSIPKIPPVKVEALVVKSLQLLDFKWPPCRSCKPGALPVGPGALTVQGSAALHWPNPLELEVTITEKGHKAPLLWLEGFSESPESLAINGRIQQRAGGWLGQWLQLPPEQMVEVAISAKGEQKSDGIDIALEQLSAPLFKQKLNLQGRLKLRPELERIDLHELVVNLNQQRHTLRGSVSPALVALGVDIQRFNLALLRPWLPDLEGGIVSAKGQLEWDWNTQHLPAGELDVNSNVRYMQQALNLKSKLALTSTQVEVKRLKANLGEMQLSAKGRIQTNGKPLALTYTLTHVRDGPIRELLPEAIAVQIPQGLSVHVQHLGGLLRGTLQAPHVITDVNILGRYDELPFAIYGNANASLAHADINQLTVEVDDASLKLDGLIDWKSNQTALSGRVRHLSPALAYRYGLNFPPSLVGFLNARWELSGALAKPAVVIDALYQGGYEHQNEVLPFNLALDASAQLGTLDDIALDVNLLNLAVFKRPLVTMKGRVNARDNDFRVVVSRLPVKLLEALGYPVGEGRAEARLRFGGSFTQPTLGGYLSYAETLAVRSATDERTEVPLIWHANVSSEEKDLVIDSSFTLDKTSAGLLSLSLPWHNYLNYALTQSGGNLPTDGSIKANMDTSALQLFMDTDQMTLQGGLEADLTLAGTAQDPVLTGELLLKNGYFKQATTGTVLSDIQIYALAEKQKIKLVTGFARDGEGGTLRLSGHVDWRDVNSNSAVNVALELKDASLVDMPNVKGAVSGKAALVGGKQGMNLTGKLSVLPLHINIDTAPAVAIPEIKVQEVYSEDAEIEARNKLVPTVALDVEVDIDNQAFIRGRGLETELEGKVLISGTAAKPNVAGSFKTVRGEIKLLQKPIKLNEGRAQFSNEAFNFHIPASYHTGDTEINIIVSGNEEEIELDLSSVPTLPQEEILSRLLFGDSVQNISAWQAMSLASAVNKISNGSSFNPLDATRDKLGFDSLSVGQESEDEGGGVNVGVGKYLNERVYLELERSSNPAQPWQGNLKIEITDELRLNSTTASTGKSSAALEWRRDY